ncbi:MAG: efflux transporter periplasmic adaptor subunit [Lentisphaerae bacterium GWF2_52_8]|nr:MAG: efflux transporter periplasmic adaptor subunit [Lentisphaerae bacterium GWF2_52_8]
MESIRARVNLKTIVPAFAAVCMMSCMQGCGPKKGAAPPPPLPEVSVITVKTEESALATELPGRVTPLLVAEVRPQIGGIIQKRLFEEGADVKAGDILYHIDPALYKASYNRAKAELGRAEARMISIRKRYDRYKKLIESSAISQQDFDNAESDLKTSEAEILSCKASVETAWINLEYTKIIAPISGRIGRSHITVGSLVSANHILPLAVIQQIDPVYVDVAQSSASLLQLKQEISKGQLKSSNGDKTKVKLILEDGSCYPLEGTLQFRDITVDQSTGSFILRIVFPNPDAVLLPGMFVRAVMEIGVNRQAILLPQQAVSRDSKGRPLALIVDSSGKVVQRILQIGQAIGDKWIVSSGLQPGDRVIMEGMQKVRPGAEVKAIPFAEAQPKANPSNAPQAAAASK